jgi:hypothetical protein
VRRHVVRAFCGVDEQGVAVRHQPFEETFHVNQHFRIVILVDHQAGGGVLDVEREHACLQSALVGPVEHRWRDVVDAAAFGLDTDVMGDLSHIIQSKKISLTHPISKCQYLLN